MINLESHKMKNAIAKARVVRPRVTRLAERSYRLTSSNGQGPSTVNFAVANGHKLAECNCDEAQT